MVSALAHRSAPLPAGCHAAEAVGVLVGVAVAGQCLVQRLVKEPILFCAPIGGRGRQERHRRAGQQVLKVSELVGAAQRGAPAQPQVADRAVSPTTWANGEAGPGPRLGWAVRPAAGRASWTRPGNGRVTVPETRIDWATSWATRKFPSAAAVISSATSPTGASQPTHGRVPSTRPGRLQASSSAT